MGWICKMGWDGDRMKCNGMEWGKMVVTSQNGANDMEWNRMLCKGVEGSGAKWNGVVKNEVGWDRRGLDGAERDEVGQDGMAWAEHEG